MGFCILGICYLCLAPHSREGFFFLLLPRAQNWTCQQWAATQLCKECHGWQLHSCWGTGWAFLVKQYRTQEPLCLGTHHGVSECPDSWKNVPTSPYQVAQCLVITTMTRVSSLVALKWTQRGYSVLLFFYAHTHTQLPSFRDKISNLFVIPLKLLGIKDKTLETLIKMWN